MEIKKKQILHVVGKRLDGLDERNKALGNTAYADDFSMEKMLHAKVLRSTRSSARIKSIDTSAAKNIPGVIAILTADDISNNSSVTNVVGQPADVGLLQAKQTVLAEDRVRFFGEPLALIAAENLDTAEAALRLIRVEYEDIPGVFDPEEAMKDEAPKVHGDNNVIAHWKLRRGDTKKGFDEADVIVENTYRTQLQEPAPMEPECGVAWIDDDGVLNLRVATQVIEHYREIAQILGIPESRVRIRGTLMGGAFGGKVDLTVEPYIALLCWQTGRPVKLTYTREEMMYGRHKRHPYKMYFKHGVTKDGKLVAMEARLISDAGAYVYLSPWVLLYSTLHSTGPYCIPNVKVDSYSVLTNNIYTSSFRAFGAMEVAVAYESQMDALARKLDMNPAEFRAKNYLSTGDEIGTGQRIESAVMLGEAQGAAVKALGDRSKPSAPHVKVGRGFATCWQSYGRMCFLHDFSSAWVGMEMDGSAVVRCGIPDLGAGERESLRQIAAELTGAPLENIHVISTDSQVTPLAGTVTATRGLYMSGNAVRMAAEAIRCDLQQKASQMLGTAPEHIDLYSGEAFVPDIPSKRVPLTQVIKALRNEGNTVEALRTYRAPAVKPVTQQVLSGQVFPDFSFFSQAVELEVDTLTGQINVLKMSGAHDVGTAINPRRVEGQIEGGMAQGLGYALLEEFVEVKGIPQNVSLISYLVPTAKDIPEIIPVILESGCGLGPFGAKGIGESTITATAPAILNAIYDAIGVRIRKTPVTPGDILEALGEKNE